MAQRETSIDQFDSIYRHGFIRAATCVPHVRVADPEYNIERTLELAGRASAEGARIILFPELGISSYSNEDLFHQDALLDACRRALRELLEASEEIPGLIIVGAPLRFDGKLFNCAIGLNRGEILGVVPKLYLPNYREFYEKRQFTSGLDRLSDDVELFGRRVPFGSNIVYAPLNVPGLVVHTEICEDLWSPIPPSTYAAMAGATVLCNLSASNSTIGKADYRKDLCAAQSGKMIAAYLYTAAGPGESTTDLAWDGHAMIYENDELLCESERFATEEQIVSADIDLERLAQDRMRMTSFNDAVREYAPAIAAIRRISFELELPQRPIRLRRAIDRFPYVPNNDEEREHRCFDAFHIQVQGLVTRMKNASIDRIVIGVSGGLDSTHALLIAVKAVDALGLPRTNVHGFSLPGFATSTTTRSNGKELMEKLGITAGEIDISNLSMQMLRDIGHPYADGEEKYDITFENVQAGARTSFLFRMANHIGGLVLGTGDLSELALGWTTYGVGDHMSHYNVNASVPKTLIQYLIDWVIETEEFTQEINDVLRRILGTAISPELIPGDGASGSEPSQKTEEVIGPYQLQDFNLYYISRYGFRPSKVAWLSWNAWRDTEQGEWPPNVADDVRRSYDLEEVTRWLRVFLRRFFGMSQFKRSAIPNGPKVGSGGSLSPRADWRAPSDASPTTWIDELDNNVPSETDRE